MYGDLISLGSVCEVAYQIKLHTDKDESDYFDWLITPIAAVVFALERNFEGMFDLNDLEIFANGEAVHNKKTGIMYLHTFPLSEDRLVLPNFRDLYPDASSKFLHFRRKFLALKDRNDPVTFIRRDVSPEEASLLCETIRRNFSKLKFRLIAVNVPGEYPNDGFNNDSVKQIEVPKSGPGGLGVSEIWCQEFIRIGLVDHGFRKEYHQIVKTGKHYVFE